MEKSAYFCFVRRLGTKDIYGMGITFSPTVIHNTRAEAETEAMRLAKLPENIDNEVFVVRALASYKVQSDPLVRKQFCKK